MNWSFNIPRPFKRL